MHIIVYDIDWQQDWDAILRGCYAVNTIDVIVWNIYWQQDIDAISRATDELDIIEQRMYGKRIGIERERARAE